MHDLSVIDEDAIDSTVDVSLELLIRHFMVVRFTHMVPKLSGCPRSSQGEFDSFITFHDLF